MKKTLLFIVLAAAVSAYSPVPDLDSYITYFAGLTVLKSANEMPDLERAARYSELETLTGITAEKADAFIHKYRNAPREWKKIQEKIKTILEEQTSIQPSKK